MKPNLIVTCALCLSVSMVLHFDAHAVTAPAIASSALDKDISERDAQTLYARGIALLCGNRTPRDTVEAARLLGLVADQGHVRAQSVLGWMYMTGTGVAQDDGRAAQWLGRAANRGETAAQNNLGVLHATGQGVKHDHAAAERWFSAAAKQGATEARENLEALRSASPPKAGSPKVARAKMHRAGLAIRECRQ